MTEAMGLLTVVAAVIAVLCYLHGPAGINTDASGRAWFITYNMLVKINITDLKIHKDLVSY